MLRMQRLLNSCIYETCRYLLILIAKNAIASELQDLSNKTKKQMKNTLRLSFKTQLDDLVFCAV